MSEPVRRCRLSANYRARRGQTLIAALAILIVLLFIGGLFVAAIAHNVAAAGRSRSTEIAQSLAEAGIQFCNAELTSSTQGADWRPVPTAPQGPAGTPAADPDYEWLAQGFSRMSMPGGRVLIRVTYDPTPSDPRSQMERIDAIGRPGDIGTAPLLDPTIYVQNGPAPRLRVERTGYKQLALTDFLRFITNKDRRAVEAVIGCGPIGQGASSAGSSGVDVGTVLGDATAAETGTGIYSDPVSGNNFLSFGAPIYCNANLRFVGDVDLYESPRGAPWTPTSPFTPNTAGTNTAAYLSSEGINVAGIISVTGTRSTTNFVHDSQGNDLQAFVNQLPGQQQTPSSNFIRPSSDPNFNTWGGIVRDNSSSPDVNGYTRSVPWLAPPSIETVAPDANVNRYVALTRDSGSWIWNNTTQQYYNTGAGGWGTGIYIDNTGDRQEESASVNGSYSLRGDWLNPGAVNGKSYWDGPFYRPPGVLIELAGDHILLTRSDGKLFRDPSGNPMTGQGGRTIDVPLSDAARKNFTAPNDNSAVLPVLDHADDDSAKNPNHAFGDPNSYGVSLVIYAEGNVRVRGAYGAATDTSNTSAQLGRVHLTIVTGGTAYIEGSVVKGDGYLDSSKVFHPEHASTCAIMAKDYVCVNPTVFTAPQAQTSVWSAYADLPFFTSELGSGAQSSVSLVSSFGVDPSTYYIGGNGSTTPGAPSPLYLFLSHAPLSSSGAVAAIDLLVNPGLSGTANATLGGQAAAGYTSTDIYPFLALGGTSLAYTVESKLPNFENRAFPLRGTPSPTSGTVQSFLPNYFDMSGYTAGEMVSFFPTLVGVVNEATGTPSPGYDNVFQIMQDQTGVESSNNNGLADYLLRDVFTAPADVRIEALLYAQNKSFFVIPGYALNPDSADSRANYASKGTRTSYEVNASTILPADKEMKDVYPFYDEPGDVRITIFGAIAENMTASMNDQAAWMGRWGYIPATHGSSAIPVPDDHLRVHDATVRDSNGNILFRYNPGEDPSADFRTYYEKQDNITRGLRFVYDPAFALPYLKPNLTGTYSNGVNQYKDSSVAQATILRSRSFPNSLDPAHSWRFTLPPIPCLPVCPGPPAEFSDEQRTVGY